MTRGRAAQARADRAGRRPTNPSTSAARRVALAVSAGGVSGLLFACSLAPFNLAALAWVAFVPLFLVVERASTSEALAAAYAAGLVMVSQVAYGVVSYDARLWVALLIILPLWALLPITLLRLAGGGGSVALSVLSAPTLWVATEVVLQDVFRLPLDVGVSQARTVGPLQLASVVGTAGLSYLLILTGVAGARAVSGVRRGGLRRAWSPVLAAASLPCLATAAGWLMMPPRSDPECLTHAAVVQPAIPFATGQASWVDPIVRAAVRSKFQGYLERRELAHTPMLFWPEGAAAFESFRLGPAREAVETLARSRNQYLVVSGIDFDERGHKFNSVFVFAPDRPVMKYDKIATVPLAEADVTPGSRLGLLPTAYGNMGALICFESAFPSFARQLAERGAAFFFVSTSDGAFGVSSMPGLHLSTSIARAVENRRTVIHASNTGPSAFIDPYGRIESLTRLSAETSVPGCIVRFESPSVFTGGGYVFRWACVVASVGILGVGALRRMRRRRSAASRTRPPVVAIGVALVGCALATAPLTVLNAWVAARAIEPHASFLDAAASLVRWSKDPPSTRLRQTAPNTCGPTALAYLASFYGLAVDPVDLARTMRLGEVGTSMAELAAAAERLGFRAEGLQQNLSALRLEPAPVMVHLQPLHFAVVLEVQDDRVVLFDPSQGLGHLPIRAFERLWSGKVLRLRPPAVQFDRGDEHQITERPGPPLASWVGPPVWLTRILRPGRPETAGAASSPFAAACTRPCVREGRCSG